MDLVGVIKGASATFFVEQLDRVGGVNLSPINLDQTQISLYNLPDKSVIAMESETTTVRLEIPNSNDLPAICFSYVDENNKGIAKLMDCFGRSSLALGQWCEDMDGTGFCSDDDGIIENPAVSPADVKRKYAEAYSLLLALQMCCPR